MQLEEQNLRRTLGFEHCTIASVDRRMARRIVLVVVRAVDILLEQLEVIVGLMRFRHSDFLLSLLYHQVSRVWKGAGLHFRWGCIFRR